MEERGRSASHPGTGEPRRVEPERPGSPAKPAAASPDRRRFLRQALPAVLGTVAGGLADEEEPCADHPAPSPPPGTAEGARPEAQRDLDERARRFLRDNPDSDPFRQG